MTVGKLFRCKRELQPVARGPLPSMKTTPVAASGGLGESALREKSRFLQSPGILNMKKRCFDEEIPKQGGENL